MFPRPSIRARSWPSANHSLSSSPRVTPNGPVFWIGITTSVAQFVVHVHPEAVAVAAIAAAVAAMAATMVRHFHFIVRSFRR
jgi:hypothetical protein